jgi:MoxR-like ATPase
MTFIEPEGLQQVLRAQAENQFAQELAALQETDTKPRPPHWCLSPQAVRTYLLGGTLPNGVVITPKYIGQPRIIETAIATLLTERGLLLLGVPGTAKSWVSEHLAAAISGDSSRMVQGTAGMSEDQLRYGWNYALLLAEGPSERALVPSPVMRAMTSGTLCRIEELTRIPSDVQDALITVLSEKALPIPELNQIARAQAGFNVIATANDRDRGVNDLSAALQRRFNTVVLPLPATLEEELQIVRQRTIPFAKNLGLPQEVQASQEIQRLIQVFRELRSGLTEDRKHKVKSPSATLSAAEAIATLQNALAFSASFGSGGLSIHDLAPALAGAVVKDPAQDLPVWKEYLVNIVQKRTDWVDWFDACMEQL